MYRPCAPRTLQGLEEDYAELAESMASDTLRVAKFQADTEREFSADKFKLETFPTLAFLPKVPPSPRCHHCSISQDQSQDSHNPCELVSPDIDSTVGLDALLKNGFEC